MWLLFFMENTENSIYLLGKFVGDIEGSLYLKPRFNKFLWKKVKCLLISNTQHFWIWTISVINMCIQSYCLSSELFIAMALETQEQANKLA